VKESRYHARYRFYQAALPEVPHHKAQRSRDGDLRKPEAQAASGLSAERLEGHEGNGTY
jgi:hypothetical protein